MPVVGGYLADRYLGQRKAVQFGAVLLVCGHFLIAFDPRTDARRDSAYTIFYMGIGMLLGLIVFVWGRPLLLGHGESRDPARLESRVGGLKFEWLIYAIGIAAVAVSWRLASWLGAHTPMMPGPS